MRKIHISILDAAHTICMCTYRLCVFVRVCVILAGLPGSRSAGCAGGWIVLLDCGVAVSRPPSRMDVGDGGKAYYHVTPQATGCHAPAVNATSTSACHKDEPLLSRFPLLWLLMNLN